MILGATAERYADPAWIVRLPWFAATLAKLINIVNQLKIGILYIFNVKNVAENLVKHIITPAAFGAINGYK